MEVNEINKVIREEIEDYLSLDEELLYSLIPPFLPKYQGTAFMTSGQIIAGKEEFEKRKPEFRQRLCQDWKLCEKIKDPTFDDTVKFIVTIGDVIAVHTAGIPPFLIGSILVKIGVREFCDCRNDGKKIKQKVNEGTDDLLIKNE